MGNTSLAGLPVMHKTWVTKVCLLLDTPFGLKVSEWHACLSTCAGGILKKSVKLPVNILG